MDRRFLSILYLLTALSVAVRAQDCPLLVTPDELGNATAPSREGLIAGSYLVGDSATAPLVQILESRIVCLAPAALSPEASEELYQWTSVIVRYTCDGAVPANTQAPCGDNIEVMAQFDFGCVDSRNPRWSTAAGSAIGIIRFATVPPDGGFATPLQVDCSFCVNPEEGGALGFSVERESHCAVLGPMMVTCIELSPPENGAVMFSDPSRIAGTVATYSCDSGFEFNGPETRVCGDDGEWTEEDPTCDIVDCGLLDNPENGEVDLSNGTTFGSIAVYSCNDGLFLLGSETRVCQSDGEWSGDPPTCAEPPLNCSLCPTVKLLRKEGCAYDCIYIGEDGCPTCNTTCDGDDGDECETDEDCDENQNCLSVGHYGERLCIDLPGDGDGCDGTQDDEGEDSTTGRSESTHTQSRSTSSTTGTTGSRSTSSTTGTTGSRSTSRGSGSARSDSSSRGSRSSRSTSRSTSRSRSGADLQPVEWDLGCRPGFVCVQVDYRRSECRPEEEGPCIEFRRDNPEASCDENGDFGPMQCMPLRGRRFRCYCSLPDGTELPDTSVVVDSLQDAPDCDALVFERCTYEVDNEAFSALHGELFVTPISEDNCSLCLCLDGEASFCQSIPNCDLFRAGSRNLGCELEGEVLSNGESVQVECNMCNCRNGRLTCTNRRCSPADVAMGGRRRRSDDDEMSRNRRSTNTGTSRSGTSKSGTKPGPQGSPITSDDPCYSCWDQPGHPVCGPDGRTYLSECYAVYCGRHNSEDLLPGPCSNYDPCEVYHCAHGEVCLPKGGVTCFGQYGCYPDDVRTCVDIDDLICEDIAEEMENLTVCGTNCETYPSICQLLQDTGGTGRVAYAGSCDNPECYEGHVCGTDGYTYDNICVLRTWSAGAHFDYPGRCLSEFDSSASVEEVCEGVREEGRCEYNSSNCDYLVLPDEGCCPVCGGVVTIGIDYEGINAYVAVLPDAETLDSFLQTLIDSQVIPPETVERCEVETQFIGTGSVQVTFGARDTNSDAQFCHEQSQLVAMTISELAYSNSDYAPPQILRFAGAAVSSPAIETSEDSEQDGALAFALSCLVLLSGIIISVMLS